MTRAFLTGYRNTGVKASQYALALGVVLAGGVASVAGPVPSMVAWANDPYALKNIDFVSSGESGLTARNVLENRTDVMLYTGGIVPYKTVYSDPDKTILEFEQVNASETVKTHFMGTSGNITNVIVQPLSDSKLRLIIRGENLGHVSVGFKDPQEPQALIAREETSLETGSAAKTGLHSEFGEAFEQMKSDTPGAGAVPARHTLGEPLSTLSMANEDPSGSARFNAGIPPRVTVAPLPLQSGQGEHFNPFEKKSAVQSQAASATPNALSAPQPAARPSLAGYTLDTALVMTLLPWAAPAGLLVVLALGLGWFIRRKWTHLNQSAEYSQALDNALPQDQVANYPYEEAAPLLEFETLPPRTLPKKNAGMDTPIGLGSLITQDRLSLQERIVNPEPEPFYDPQKAERDWINSQRAKLGLLAGQETALHAAGGMQPATLPNKQVVNRYAQQNTPVSRRPMAAPIGSSQPSTPSRPALKPAEAPLRSEGLKRQAYAPATPSPSKVIQPPIRTLEQTDRVFGRKSTAKSAGAKTQRSEQLSNNALPNNPEVLAFLNAVAEKMDREGRGALLKPVASR